MIFEWCNHSIKELCVLGPWLEYSLGLSSAVQYSTVQYSTMKYSTVQHSRVQ